MGIAIQYQPSIYVMNEDGEFVCPHSNVEVEEPCCKTVGGSGYIECGCAGMASVYCPDCDNQDMTLEQADQIIQQELGYECIT